MVSVAIGFATKETPPALTERSAPPPASQEKPDKSPMGPPKPPVLIPSTQAAELFNPPNIPMRLVDAIPLPAKTTAEIPPTSPDSLDELYKTGLLLRVLIDSNKVVLEVKIIRGVGNPFLEDALAREMKGKPLLNIKDSLATGETAWVEILVAMKGGGLVP